MSNTAKAEFYTPVGRMVQGSFFEASDTDMKGRPLTDKQGKPRVEYFIALAVPKTDPDFNTMWATIQGVAQAGFPNGEYNNPNFSWKHIDGDTQPEKDGFKGCHILKFKGGFAPRVFTKGGVSQIVDPAQAKRGYYYRVYGSVAPNGDLEKPGVYLNYVMFELVGYGEEIIGGPSGESVFGAKPAGPLPAGASDIPVAGAPLSTGAPVAPGGPVNTGAPVAPGGPVNTGAPVAPPR
jgi:hypothetical protein